MEREKKITVIIPVKAVSTRVPNKNTKKFANHSLTEIKIQQMIMLKKSCQSIGRIIVDTDSDEAVEIARRMGVEVRIRPEYYSGPTCQNYEYYEYLAASNNDCEVIMISQVTSPLVTTDSYINAVNLFIKYNFDSLVSFKRFKNFLWNSKEPINYDAKKMPNSQDLQTYYIPTFGIMICKVDELAKSGSCMCGNMMAPVLLEDVEATDIDTQLDFDIAEFLYRKLKLHEDI